MRKFAAAVLLSIMCLTASAAPTIERFMPTYASTSSQSATQAATLSELMYALGNLYTYINSNYLYEIDNQKMQDAVISAMVDSLGDKYSYYITPENAEEYAEDNAGAYVGIGTYLTKVNPTFIDWDDPSTYMVVITSPFPGGPADRAGIRAGDMISHVDGEEVYDLTATAASKAIRGQKDTSVTLTIHRGDAVFDITVKREVVTSPSTKTCMIDGTDVGYLAILEFSQTTFDSVQKDLEDLLERGAKRLIIDLRNNGGGNMDSSIGIANMFLSEGLPILTTHYKETSTAKDVTFTSTDFKVVPDDVEVIVLVNKGTASASEILTAGLQQNGRAKVLGTQTFGKGIFQYSVPFLGGYLHLTVANYFTPDGSNIHEVGLTPDYIVEDGEEDYTDEQLQAYSDLLSSDILLNWAKERPEYTYENICAFAETYEEETGIPYNLLCLAMRNEYYYDLPYDERPVVDMDFDIQLVEAVRLLTEEAE